MAEGSRIFGSVSYRQQLPGESDPFASGSLFFFFATIDDAFAHVGAYSLRLPAGPLIPAQDLYHLGSIPFGARPLGGYPVKSRVLAAYSPRFNTAVILGAAPLGHADPRFVIPDSLVMRPRAGLWEDAAHSLPFNDPNCGFVNSSLGRPTDTLPGDWGSINDLGVAVGLGRFMAFLKASDLAKVEAFWGDDLLRIVGYNYERFTAGVHEHGCNDEGEYSEVMRSTPYPWEGMGVKAKDSDAAKDEDDSGLKAGSEKAAREPKEDDQLIVPRRFRARGFLGDVDRDWVCLPEDDLDVEKYDRRTKYYGLLEVHRGINGSYSVRSAKEITLEKVILIPVPKELKAPEDPTGDSEKSGYVNAGWDEDVPEFEWGDDTPDIRAAQLYDYQAWLMGRYTCVGLYKHEKDWYYPNPSELDGMADRELIDPSKLQMEYRFLTDLPAYVEKTIDGRPGHTVRYYKSRSCIKQLDDGGVLLEDGYGSQLLMTGGSIFLKCAGDVWQLPGRNAVTWAPHDAVLRAGNSADISAAKKDVRIKAEKNLHMLGGNSGNEGGILLESRSIGSNSPSDFEAAIGEKVVSYGIVLMSRKSEIDLIAKDMYLGLATENPGTLVLDSDKGQFYGRGSRMAFNVQDQFTVAAGDPKPENVLILTPENLMVTTPAQFGGAVLIAPVDNNTASLVVGGPMRVHEILEVGGSVVTNTGFVQHGTDNHVSPMQDPVDLGESPQDMAAELETYRTQEKDDIDTLEQDVKTDTEKPGNERFQKKVGFSCRDTVEDIRLDEETFRLFEARWQQLLRLGGGGTKTWDEPVVEAPTGKQTRPHPGQEAWEDWSAFKTVENVNYDVGGGKPDDRDGMTKAGQAPDGKTLKAGYAITAQE